MDKSPKTQRRQEINKMDSAATKFRFVGGKVWKEIALVDQNAVTAEHVCRDLEVCEGDEEVCTTPIRLHS